MNQLRIAVAENLPSRLIILDLIRNSSQVLNNNIKILDVDVDLNSENGC